MEQLIQTTRELMSAVKQEMETTYQNDTVTLVALYNVRQALEECLDEMQSVARRERRDDKPRSPTRRAEHVDTGHGRREAEQSQFSPRYGKGDNRRYRKGERV